MDGFYLFENSGNCITRLRLHLSLCQGYGQILTEIIIKLDFALILHEWQIQCVYIWMAVIVFSEFIRAKDL